LFNRYVASLFNGGTMVNNAFMRIITSFIFSLTFFSSTSAWLIEYIQNNLQEPITVSIEAQPTPMLTITPAADSQTTDIVVNVEIQIPNTSQTFPVILPGQTILFNQPMPGLTNTTIQQEDYRRRYSFGDTPTTSIPHSCDSWLCIRTKSHTLYCVTGINTLYPATWQQVALPLHPQPTRRSRHYQHVQPKIKTQILHHPFGVVSLHEEEGSQKLSLVIGPGNARQPIMLNVVYTQSLSLSAKMDTLSIAAESAPRLEHPNTQ